MLCHLHFGNVMVKAGMRLISYRGPDWRAIAWYPWTRLACYQVSISPHYHHPGHRVGYLDIRKYRKTIWPDLSRK
jgi:hypothetical protein